MSRYSLELGCSWDSGNERCIMDSVTLLARMMATASRQKKMFKSEVPLASLRSLIRTLVTSTFLLVHQTGLHATATEASTTGDLSWTDFEKGLGDLALDSERLKPCLQIEDAGLRAGCSLIAALETEVAAAATAKKEFASGSSKLEKEGNVSQEGCAYRKQGGPSLHKFATKMHPFMKKVLEKYATLYRKCTELEYEKLEGMYKKKKSPQCRYVVWSCTFGLGNKLMSLLSTFLYAILSQRVLLIDSPGWEHLFCEPFPGSPFQIPKGFSLSEDMAPTFAHFRNTRCTDSSQKQGPCSSNRPYVVELGFTGVSQPEDHTFLVCPTAMAAVRQIPFLHFRNSNQHFAVGFFLNPTLRPLLELLFPEHNVFHMLAQAFLSPSDVVWAQIKHFHEQYLQPAYRNVGVQLRESKGEYRKYYDEVVPLCIQSKAALCPIELEEQKELEEQQLQLAHSVVSSPKSEHHGNDGVQSNFSRPLVSIYVSSLVGGHYESLKQSVAKLEPEMRQRFVVVAQEADWEQREDTVHMQKALVDMWVLSLSDVLLTSHMSTFGYTAQGLGGLTPFHLKPWLDNACWLAASSDPCFHFAPHHVNCGPLDRNFTFTDPRLQAPYIVACPDLPETGLQLTE